MTWEEIDRLRRLVPERPDWHLANWARWSRVYRHAQGHRSRAHGFACGGLSSIEALEDEVDAWTANVADAVIDGLPVEMRNAIATVYSGGSWHLRVDRLDVTLAAAAGLFWERARRKGLT